MTASLPRSPVLALLAAAVGCGGGGGRGAAEPSGIAAAALPFQVLRARGGEVLPWDAFLGELAAADAVCIGEHHPNPHDHWAQLHILRGVSDRTRAAGKIGGLGMEMFQRPFQGVLDDFAAGRIDEAALLSRSAWKDRWGYDWSLYRPLVMLVRERRGALLALNTERELTKKVSRQGIDKMTPADRSKLPELVLDDADHRAWWNAIMGDMGGAHGHAENDGAKKEKPDPEEAELAASAERIYAAQVLWDETMADGASKWLAGGKGRHLVIVAGNGHCHESAIVRRLERRGIKAVVSVRPIVDDGEGNVGALLAEPENDYLFVMSRDD